MVKTGIKAAGASDMGRVRQNNEDAWYLDPDRGIYLVVDGIGGQAAGEKAAAIAVECVRARLERPTGSAEERIREAIAIANQEILRQASANPEWRGMACVLTLALLDNGSAVIGHVGDSRLYEIRPGRIRKVTHDHSPVGEMEDSGQLGEAEAMRHPRRNEVYRDVGSEDHSPNDVDFIEVLRIPFEPDSALLLCSDGLSDLVPSARIREAVEQHAGDPAAAARALIEAANRAGGKDNITVVIAEGERFSAPVAKPAPEPAPRRFPWIAATVALVCAAAGAAAGVWWQRQNTPPPVVIAPRVLAVGGAAPGSYATISTALAAARSGDTVEVPLGDYSREKISLRSGVTLRSRVPREAVLLGPVYAQNIRGARLSGFTIHGAEGPGIQIVDSEIEVDDNQIDGADIGIEIRGSSRAALLGNAIRDCGTGVLAGGPSEPWLSHNSFQRDKTAVAAQDGARPALIGNIFEKSPLDLPPAIDLKAVWEKNFRLDAGAPAPRRARPERPVGEPK